MAKTSDKDSLFPGLEAGQILVDEDIERLVRTGLLIDKDDFDGSCLQGCSYDIRVGDKALLGGEGQQVDLRKPTLELQPGAYAGVLSLEKIKLLGDTFARLGAKRKFSYEGLILLSGSLVDPGYSGHLLFGIYNASPKKRFIRRRDKIVTAVFMRAGRSAHKQASADEYLAKGEFPPDFLKAMDELEVLPYVELNRRIAEIEKIQGDILDLKKRVTDVIDPIKDLRVTVEALAGEVTDNNSQIKELTANVTKVAESVNTLRERSSELGQRIGEQEHEVSRQKVATSILKWAVGAIWTILVILLTIYLQKWFAGQ